MKWGRTARRGNAEKQDQTAASVQLSDVQVWADDRVLLEVPDLSLVEPRISVIGPNGGGKSTLLQVMNGLVPAAQGQIQVGGNIGYVFANPAAQLVMPTPLEDTELSIRKSVRDSDQRRHTALACLRQLGIEDLAERSSHEISAGQQQLVALATVLVMRPRLLLLDEPTTLLDRANARLFTNTVETLCAEEGIQVITATHDLELASKAQRTLLVSGGRIVADGHPDVVVPEYIRMTD